MFSAMLVDDKGLQQVPRVAAHSTFTRLKYKMLLLHIYVSFRGAPAGFYQVLILPVMDKGINMNTLIFHPVMSETVDACNIMGMHVSTCIDKYKKIHMKLYLFINTIITIKRNFK